MQRTGLQPGHTGLQPGYIGLQPGHTGLQDNQARPAYHRSEGCNPCTQAATPWTQAIKHDLHNSLKGVLWKRNHNMPRFQRRAVYVTPMYAEGPPALCYVGPPPHNFEKQIPLASISSVMFECARPLTRTRTRTRNPKPSPSPSPSPSPNPNPNPRC